MKKRVAKAVRDEVAKAVAPPVPSRKKRRQSPNLKLHGDVVRAEAAERANHALFLRRNGASYVEIAREMGTSEGAVARLVQKAIDAIPKENAEAQRARLLLSLEARQLETHQLIAELKARLRALGAGEHAAACACHRAIRAYHDTLTRIGDAHARLTGANAPILHEVKLPPPNAAAVRDMTDDDLRKIASGDFSPLAPSNGVAVDRHRPPGDDPSLDGEGGGAGPH